MPGSGHKPIVFEAYYDGRRGTGGWRVPLCTETQLRAFIRAYNRDAADTALSFDADEGTLSGDAEHFGTVEDDDGNLVDGDITVDLGQDIIRTDKGRTIIVWALDFGWVFDLHTL